MSEAVDVVLVDDHHMFRTGVKASLDAGVRVVGEADTVGGVVSVTADACTAGNVSPTLLTDTTSTS